MSSDDIFILTFKVLSCTRCPRMLIKRLTNSSDILPWLDCCNHNRTEWLKISPKTATTQSINSSGNDIGAHFSNKHWRGDIYDSTRPNQIGNLNTASLATLASFCFTSRGNLRFTPWNDGSASWISKVGGLAARKRFIWY